MYRYNVLVCERECVHVRVYVCVCVCVCERESVNGQVSMCGVCVHVRSWGALLLGHQSTTLVVVRSEPHHVFSIIPPPSCQMGT